MAPRVRALSSFQASLANSLKLVGKKIAVYANYLKVIPQPGLELTRYHVEVSPEAKGKKLTRIFQLLRESVL
jgi:hypothetical protein